MLTLFRSLILLVLMTFLLISCAPEPPAVQPITPALDPSQVLLIPEHQRCEKDDDCVIFPMECSDCDCETVLNWTYLEAYQAKKAEVCEGYRGPMCEIYCPVEPKCVQAKCTVVPLPTPAQ